MASAPSRKHGLGLLNEDLEEWLMLEDMNLDALTFDVEREKKGLGFLVAEVRDRKTFQESFDRLVRKGCRPDILFLGLHYLLRSELHEVSCPLPGKREILSLATRLRKTVEDIRAFEKKYAEAHRLRASTLCIHDPRPYDYELFFNARNSFSPWIPALPGSPIPEEIRGFTVDILAYAEMLQSWWTPRSDAVKSYAAIYNCAYAKVATGKPQFSIVSDLNTSFIGKSIQPDTLRKNLSRFQQRNRQFYLQMVSNLRSEHGATDGTLPEPVDWPKLFGSKADKSK